MKNLKPYPSNCFDVHQNIVNKKRSLSVKERLINVATTIEEEYNKYEEHFETNTLEAHNPNTFLTSYKEDLNSLYTRKVSTDIRESLNKIQTNTIRQTCQYCTLDSAGTLDHILPKTEFPEFSVNPKNLFPSCDRCNKYKLARWRENGEKLFLNLFLDELPTVQYLFVDIFLDIHNEIDFKFKLENRYNIDARLYKLIESHYARLNLFNRMREKSINSITELENTIFSMQAIVPSLPQIIEIIKNKANRDKEDYGYNHWRSILYLALVESPIFMSKFTQLAK